MAHKSNDLFSLLSSRGRGRSRSGRRSGGLFAGVTGFLGALLPKPTRHKDVTRPRHQGVTLNGLSMAGIVFACLGVGYLLGDAFPLRAGGRDLNASLVKGPPEAQKPGMIRAGGELSEEEECARLSGNALTVGYFGGDDRAKAAAIAKWLRGKGLDKARIYKQWLDDSDGTSYWVALVYYKDAADEAVARQALLTAAFPREFGIDGFKIKREGWPWEMPVE